MRPTPSSPSVVQIAEPSDERGMVTADLAVLIEDVNLLIHGSW